MFANSITVNGLVVTEASVISQIILKEVLLHDPGRAGHVPTPIPALQPGELFQASKLLSAGKGLGPNWVPDSFFSRPLNKENEAAKKELLDSLGNVDLLQAHFESRIVLINKNKVGVPEAKDIRPIAIQSPIQKMYELPIAPQLKRLNALTSPKQFGFKPNKCTSHAILGLFSFIKNLPTPD